MKWFPNRKGTAMGFVVGGFGGGAMVFNQIQTAIVNFENYKVSSTMTSVLTMSDLIQKPQGDAHLPEIIKTPLN